MKIPDRTTAPAPFADVTGVILAGGASRRMGRDKATLVLQGATMFERVAATLAPLFPRLLIAGERTDLVRAGLPCLADRYPGSALGGLYTALAAATTSYIFVAPCDLPYPDARLVCTLVELRRGWDVVVIHSSRGWEPLFAVYAKSCLPIMQAALEAGEHKIQALYPRLQVRAVDEAELPAGWERGLLNLNHPEDVALLREAVAEEGPSDAEL